LRTPAEYPGTAKYQDEPAINRRKAKSLLRYRAASQKWGDCLWTVRAPQCFQKAENFRRLDMAWQRPTPRLDTDNRPFWTGGAEGNLNIMQCGDCSGFIHPPRLLCYHCLSENVAPVAVAGTGEIDTYTINYQAWAKDMDVPFVIARVSLDGVPGVYLTTNIVGSLVNEVDIGDKVQVTFEEQDGIFFPLFEKVAA
jgi:uncharacterized protein